MAIRHKHMLESTIDSLSKDHNNLQSRYDSDAFFAYRKFILLFRKQYKYVAHYFDPSYVKNPEQFYQMIASDVKRETKRVIGYLQSNESSSHLTFIDIINEECNGLIDKIRNDFPCYSQQDIVFIAYLIAGFDCSAISTCLGYSPEVTRTRKCRYKRRLLEYDGPNARLYKMWFDDDSQS